MATVDWRPRIVELVLVKQRLRDVDQEGLWPHHLPGVAATEAQLLGIEARIGESLDASHRAFLATAGGWPGFLQTVDLFGPGDFLGSTRWARAVELLGYLEDDVLASAGFRREHVLPIAASTVEIDLFIIGRRSSTTPGVVVWFAGDEVERFADFDEYFAAMLDFNRREIEVLQRGRAQLS